MGNCNGTRVSLSTAPNWKIIKTLEAERDDFQRDPSTPALVEDDQVVWSRLLKEPEVQRLISHTLLYGERRFDAYNMDDYLNMLACWIEIGKYTAITADPARRRKAVEIYNAHVISFAPHVVPMPNTQRARLCEALHGKGREAGSERCIDGGGGEAAPRIHVGALDVDVFAGVSTDLI
jgi:hypothetical protein